MRKVILGLALASALSPAVSLAGGVPEVPVVTLCGDCSNSSSKGLIVPLLLLLVIGAAVAH